MGFFPTQNPYTVLTPFVLLVGRPSLDLGTLRLKETFNLLRGVGLVARVD